MNRSGCPIEEVTAAAYRIPTDFPEADGTFRWDGTTIVVVHVRAGAATGLGYTYTTEGAAEVIRRLLAPAIEGCDVFAVEGCWWRMVERVRNAGRPGLCSMAISAVDVALWDLKARVLGIPLAALLGPVRQSVTVYGSGGFTSYPHEKLQEQLAGWVARGIPNVKMKVGSEPARDPARVGAARAAIGDAGLFVDANGAYDAKQALALADAFRDEGVTWFEEPVSSDNLDGLRFLRESVPAPMEVAAGEYGWDTGYFRRMLAAGAVDVLQADATRCGGVTGFLKVAALCEAFEVPLSGHCAPALHTHAACAARPLRNLEYFHDHVRIEEMLFDGTPVLRDGALHPDFSKPGHGLELRKEVAEEYAV